jgi:hypothetical protein
MALIGSVTGSVRAQKLDFGSSNAILTASNSGENLIMSSSNLFISSSAYMSGVMTINQPGGVSGITLQSAGGGAALNVVAAQGSSYNSDLYVGNSKTPFPDLWTFSYRGTDNSFLFFSYNNNAFTNVLRLFTNGGIGMGPVAATATAPGTNVIYTNNLIGIGTGLTAPTARIHIVGGGDSGGAPLRLNSGSLLTSPLSGSIEFNGTNLFITSGTTRQAILTTLTNNAAVTSSFIVSTASDMTLRVPGTAGETSRSVIVTSNQAPTPALGSDTFLFVSGARSSSGTSIRGAAVFGGDVVVSGNIRASEIELGSASAFVSSSNGSSLEIGAATQVLVMSGGGATSKDPRNLPDVNFFVSGAVGAKDSTTLRGAADFGGDLMVSGQIFFGGDTTLPASVSRMLNSGQVAYWQNWYPINPVINIAGKFGASLTQFQVSTVQQNISGRLRIGSLIEAATAYLHITRSLGAANTAPIKLQAGTLIAAPEEGAIEFNGANFFVTSGSTRQTILTTLANNAAVTSSFMVSTASNMTLRVPGAAGDTARSIILTSDRTPTPTTGSDVFVFVSGSTSSKGTSTRGTAVFGGDMVISGTLHGGVQFGSNTGLTIQANKVQVTANTLSFGQSGGSDVGFFVSGSIESRGTAFSGGTSLFGGDLYTSGNVYAGTIATAAGGTALYADILTGKLIFNASDLKLKKDFQPILSPLEKTCALTGTYYFAIEDDPKPENRQIGLIAQNVLAQVPELTVQYSDGVLGVRYEKAVALLVEAIKEQQAVIENLKSRIEILESK